MQLYRSLKLFFLHIKSVTWDPLGTDEHLEEKNKAVALIQQALSSFQHGVA